MAHPTLVFGTPGLAEPEFHICQDLRYPGNYLASDASVAPARLHLLEPI